jgi:hypothetical protein
MMKHFLKHFRSHKNSAGISLLELLLSIGITAVILIGGTKITQDWAERMQNRNEANYLLTVHNAAKSYASVNFSRIMRVGFNENMLNNVPNNALLNNPGRAIVVTIGNTGVSPFFLKDGTTALGADFTETSPRGRDIRIYVRNVGFIGEERTLEIITTTTLAAAANSKRQDQVMTRDIAQVLGPQAGVYTAAANNCAGGVFNGSYGNWRLNNTRLSAAGMMAGYPAYCPAINVAQGLTAYVALRDRITYKNADVSDYLYRVAIPGAPEANRMETNIDMNGNDILNVASISADNLQVNGNLVAGGRPGLTTNPATGVGATAVFVDESLRVGGNSSYIRGRQLLDPTGSRFIYGGNLRIVDAPARVGGNLRLQNLTASTGTLNAAGMTISGTGNVVNIGGSVGVQNTLTIDTLTARQAVANNTTIRGGTAAVPAVSASRMQAASAGFQQLNAPQATAVNLSLGSTLTTQTARVIDDLGVGGAANIAGGIDTDILNALGPLSYCRSSRINYPPNTSGGQPITPYDCKGYHVPNIP